MAARLEDVDETSLAAAVALARRDPRSCAVVLVEGMSDQAAVQTLAERSGRDLRAEGVFVVPMGGATNVRHFVDLFGPGGFGVRLAGLCDQGEERDFRRGLDGVGTYFVCVADLEDELIRALGTSRVEELIEAEGESGPFLTFTRQPAHRDTARDRQLRRFMGTRSGRKIRYGHLLAAAVDLTLIPAPLASLLSAV
jgi:Overcoming lysogenization defect protein-like, TOPRIM domain